MGIFSKQGRVKSQQSATTVIAKGCSIEGQLRLESDLQVDGAVDGEIKAEHTLTISETGIVSGEVYAERVLVNGKFEGTCHAETIEILSRGSVVGTIYSDNLSIQPGGKFTGVTHATPEQQVVELSDAKKMAESNVVENKVVENKLAEKKLADKKQAEKKIAENAKQFSNAK
ncbi:polymer-forming cytoskeletal protein [Vibrio sp. ZSDE26]|uniref:Polymer-forming cytoskeletal protein n=1 Tax=Vibrio amylolyticus TaxID=2847292 RepID=A0A9X1XK39_9VIBR|nr:polymer-forming cytoskeletal protein [Vibrio amylolyticus]MCK6264329.1 polymer-forming cytoskeletal protein [Vibrio amylolyticus]